VNIGPLLDELCQRVIYLNSNVPVVIVNKEPDPEYDEFQANDADEFTTVAEIIKYASADNEIGLEV
jgi:hypothetical protein